MFKTNELAQKEPVHLESKIYILAGQFSSRYLKCWV